MTLAGVALGAGLTYGFSALNRRHQEEREDKTRWYEARLKAYIELSHAIDDMTTMLFLHEEPPSDVRWDVTEALHSVQSTVHIVGSPDFFEEADSLIRMATRILDRPRPPTDEDKELWMRRVLEIKSLAGYDLGYPDTWGIMMRWSEEYRERMEGEERAKKMPRAHYVRARLIAKQLTRRARARGR